MKSLFTTRAVAFATLTLALTLPLGCGGGGGGGATPQETFKIANAAVKKKDFAGFMNCMTPNAQGVMAGSMAMAGTMFKMMGGMMGGMGGEEAKKKMEATTKTMDAVMNKYGVKVDPTKLGGMMSGKEPDPAVLGGLVESVKDKAGFVAEMMSALETVGDKKPGSSPSDSFDGTLENVKVDGDSASGTIKNANGKSTNLKFKKIDGRWLIDNFMD